MLKIIREVITAHEGKKKATEIEDALIKVGVKVILLWQNKDITNKQLQALLPELKVCQSQSWAHCQALWSDAIDFCEMSFAYSPESFAEKAKALVVGLEKIVAGGLMGEKNVKMMQDTLDYLSSEPVLDRLFKDEAQAKLKADALMIMRSAWIKVFKDAAKWTVIVNETINVNFINLRANHYNDDNKDNQWG